MSFQVVDVPKYENGGRPRLPIYDEIASALVALPEGKAALFALPEDKNLDSFRAAIITAFNRTRRKLDGFRVYCKAEKESGSVIVWKVPR